MLFGYPREATKGDWLHACLCRMLRAIHTAVAAGKAAPNWPAIIPEKHRENLETRKGLRSRLEAYAAAFSKLIPGDRAAVCRALSGQNRIRGLLAGSCSCQSAGQLPSGIRDELQDLSKEAFRLLGECGIRDDQYEGIYRSLQDKVCPFCGLEYLDAPSAPREDLDHYLPRSQYPFAASNTKNLVPMGGRCNSGYKGTTDVLWDGGVRRRAFYPYDHAGVQVSLVGTLPFGGGDTGQHPQWTVSFVPESEEARTWDSVFRIRERYVRSVLEPEYESWLDRFASYCKSAGLAPSDDHGLVDALDRFRRFLQDEGFSDRSFLKAAVFELLLHHCDQGDPRLIRLLRDIVSA